MKATAALRDLMARVGAIEEVNFLVTNRIPRRLATRFMGWFSRIEHPLVRDASIALWRALSDLDLSDARKARFRSLHDCFTRELAPGSRPLSTDPATLASPSDGIVVACGAILDGALVQAKGLTYRLDELLGDSHDAESVRGGTYVTLRLTATMYHRFHSPSDARVDRVVYIAGDTWNVNPPALKRIAALYCRNERVVIRMRLEQDDARMLLVPVAAILVGGIRLHCADLLMNTSYRGPAVVPCDARVARGEELGWFEHGSTIVVLVPAGFRLAQDITTGSVVRAGQALLTRDSTGG